MISPTYATTVATNAARNARNVQRRIEDGRADKTSDEEMGGPVERKECVHCSAVCRKFELNCASEFSVRPERMAAQRSATWKKRR